MNDFYTLLEEKFFPSIRKPGRYVAGELNARIPENTDLQIALAFPDLYEIGFPYLGFHILYHILNDIKGISCQRIYAPASDAEEH